MKDWAEITKTRRLDMLERVVFPAIGKLPVREITSYHILKILQETAKRGAPTVAAHADTNNARRTYNHATYLDERKVMMQEWADKLDGWVNSTDISVDDS